MNEQELSARPTEAIRLSVVVPVFNEADILPELNERLQRVFESNAYRGEIVYVNDGSTDASLELMEELRRGNGNVTILDLSRNFGQQLAITAGLDHAVGEAVVVIDADLQDPPELIPELVKEWRQGYDVVYAQRIQRKGETAIKKLTAAIFYRLMSKFGDANMPRNAGHFRLLSRRAVDALSANRESNRFMYYLYAWVGFPQKAVPYERDSRHAGKSSWNYWRLWNLAIEGITSATIAPLKLISYFGALTALCAFLFGGFFLLKTLLYGDPVTGFPTLITVMLFLGGVQLIALGVIGEYLGRTFLEAKKRPLYLLKGMHPSGLYREQSGNLQAKE